MTNRRQLIPHYVLVLLIFIFSLFIAWCVPYTHDDWDWGREIGITNWLQGTFNNRYIGSFFVVIMTRSPILKTLIMAAVMTCLPVLCLFLGSSAKSPLRNRIYLCILSYFVVFSMPVITWRQTYGWVAGFSNFSMGAFFLMLLLTLLKTALYTSDKYHPFLSAGCFILSFSAQLCSENISFFFPLFLIISMFFLRFWQRKELRIVFVAALLGTILGTALMFMNPLYLKLASTGVAKEQFRSLTFSPTDSIFTIIHTLLNIFFGDILPSLYETHPVLVIFLAIGAWIDLFPRNRTLSLCLCLPMLLYGIGCCYCAEKMRQIFGWLPASALFRSLGAAIFTSSLLITTLVSPHRHKWHTLAFSLFAIALITPFAAISYTGPRCYHISHFCLLVAGIAHYDRINFNLSAKLFITTALVLTIGCLSQAYAAIGACSILRQEITQEVLQSQADTLVLPSVDGRYTYSWAYNPQNDLRADHYREFYGLPESLDLVFLPYGSAELWPNIPDQMYEDAMYYAGH